MLGRLDNYICYLDLHGRSAWDKYRRNFRRQKRRARILGRHPFAVPVFTGLFLILITFILLSAFGSSKVIQVTHPIPK